MGKVEFKYFSSPASEFQDATLGMEWIFSGITHYNKVNKETTVL